MAQTMTDEQLLAAARKGDEAAIEGLLARHEKQIFRFGLRMCGNEDDARDVLQETLLSAFRGLPAFRGDARLSTWLYQIARSFCSKARRRGVDEPAETLALDAPAAAAVAHEGALPDASAHARQIGELIQAAMLALPEAQREVIVLRDVEGLSAEEAAQILGLEVPALKSRLHRARLALREHLSGLLAEGPAPASPCHELAQDLAAYAAAEIDQAACVRIEEHLGRCPRCAAACSDLQRSVSLCRRIPGDAVPQPIRAAVKRALISAI